MTPESAISVAGVGKRYVKYEDTPTLIGSVTRLRHRSRRSTLWALRDINLELPRSSCIGVIGRNGSGKTTLLRMLAGVTAPTVGTVTVRGQVAPLISVGVGFHHELSGRENVYLSGTILGLSKRDIDERIDEIVDFAEIGDFIDTPVKFYSSGMYVRLGFAVSVFADPEILLVDEVLAVGDLAFQMKCYDRMEMIRSSGATIVVVSHNLNAIRRLCDRALVIHDGTQRHDGDTAEAIALFHHLLGEERDVDGDVVQRDSGFRGTGSARFTRFALASSDRPDSNYFDQGQVASLGIDIEVDRSITKPVLCLNVFHESGVQVYGEEVVLAELVAGDALTVSVELPINVPGGSYSAEVGLVSFDGSVHAPSTPAVLFFANGRPGVSGVADLQARFDVVPAVRSS